MTFSVPVTHSAFEDRFPDELDAALALEQNRQALHIRRTGSLDGFVPSREFPCLGVIRPVVRGEYHWEVACSVCGWASTIRSPERESRESRERAAW